MKELFLNIAGVLLTAAGAASIFLPKNEYSTMVSGGLLVSGLLSIITSALFLRARLKRDQEAAINRIESAYGVVYESEDRTLPLKEAGEAVFVVTDQRGNHLPCTSEIVHSKDHTVSLKVVSSGGYMLPMMNQ